MTLFDMEPLSPAEVVRRRGWHPVTMLPLDPNEGRSCGNCATRRWIWDEQSGNWFDTVCAAITLCEWKAERGMVASGPPDPDDYCDDDCCTADKPAGTLDRSAAWPWPSATEAWMPACSRWSDMEAERVVSALGTVGR